MDKTLKRLRPLSYLTLISFTISSVILFNPEVVEACCAFLPEPTLIPESPPPPPTCPPVNGGFTTGVSGGGGTACIGTPMKINLTYNSKDPYQGNLGRGWTHNFNMNLIPGNKAQVNATILAPSTPYWSVWFQTYMDGKWWWRWWSGQGGVINIEWDGMAYSWPGGWQRVPDGTYILNIYASYPFSRGAYTSIQVTIGDYTVMREDGQRHIYTKNPDGTFSPKTPGVYSTLIKNIDGTFSLIDKNQEVCLFSPDGKLTSPIDKNGNEVSLRYDETSRLSRIVDPSGRETILTYDTNNRLSSIIDPIGRTTSFQYNTNNLLTSIQDPAGNITSYTYGDQFRITNITKNGISRQSLTYDTQGRVSVIYDGENNPTTYTYQPQDRRTLIQDGRANTTKYTYNENWRITKIEDPYSNITNYTYDNQNNLLSTIDPLNHTTRYEYNTGGNITKEIDAKNNETVIAYDGNNNLTLKIDPLGHEYQYFYDSNNNLIKAQDPLRGETTYTYSPEGEVLTIRDANGNTTENTYDEFGNVIKVQDAEGNATEYTYDLSDRKLTQKDPQGNITNYTYNDIDQLTKITYHDGTYEEFIYDCCNLTLRKDQSGNETNYVYDANNRLKSVQDPLGGVTSYTYDQVGNRTKIIDPGLNETTYTYDKNNRLTSVAYPTLKTETYTYDSAGRMITKQDDNSNITTYDYDELNRLIKKTYSDGTFVSFAYDKAGNQLTMQDTTGLTTNTYDELNRVKVIDGPSANDSLTYSYDPVGNREKMQDQSGAKTEYAYDKINRLKEIHYTPSGSTTPQITKYDYDLASNLKEMTYPNEVIATYTYDSLNRLINLTNRKSSPPVREGGGEGEILSSYTYDLDPTGMRKGVTLADGTRIDYTYDNTYQLLSEVQKGPDGKITYNASYTYDKNGNRLTMDKLITTLVKKEDDFNRSDIGDNWGMTRSWKIDNNKLYTWNANTLHKGIFNLDNPTKIEVTINAKISGEKRRSGIIIRGNGEFYYAGMLVQQNKWVIGKYKNDIFQDLATATKSTEKDKDYRMKVEISWAKVTLNVDDTKVLEHDFGTLPKGRAGLFSDKSHTYFDDFKVEYGTLKQEQVTYTYNEQNQLITSVSLRGEAEAILTTYTYDKNGNLTQKDEAGNTTQYAYDYENRLTKITYSDEHTDEYVYDGLGRKVRATESGVTTNYFYDGLNVTTERDNTGATLRTYSLGPGLDRPISVTQSGHIDYYLFDGLGSTTGLATTLGNISASYTYDAWGNILSETGTVNQSYRFTTRPYNLTSGFIDLRARAYVPSAGRFIQRDPLGLRPDVNLYRYVNNNPVNLVDPTGLFNLNSFGCCMQDALEGAALQCLGSALAGVIACGVICAIPITSAGCSTCIRIAVPFVESQCGMDLAWIVANAISCALTGDPIDLPGLPPGGPPPIWPIPPIAPPVPIPVPG